MTFSTFTSIFPSAAAVDAIAQSESVRDDKSFLVSKDGSFALGFFSPGKSKNRYLGIWYNKTPAQTVVWVANRSKDSSGVLALNKTTGDFQLLGREKTVVWSTNSSRKAQSPLLFLMDSGNLVLKDKTDENPENFLWQSFDFPCDTLLAGMKLGWNRRTGLNRRLSAWKSPDDPSPGSFSWEMELHAYPEPVMWNGTKKYLRSGPWNGVQYSGKPTKALPLLNFSFFSNEDEVYLMIDTVNKSVIARTVLYDTAPFHRQTLLWSEPDKNWTLYVGYPRDQCESYGLCGAYGACFVSGSPVCQCLDRFRPKSPERWKLNDWSSGCERRKALKYCRNDDRFVRYKGLKLPDTTHTWVDNSMNIEECRAKCLSNCSCMAYANTEVRDGGKGCVVWFGDLIDIRQIPGGGMDSQDLFIRVSASELRAKGEEWKMGVIVAAAISVLLGMVVVYYYSTCKSSEGKDNEGQLEDLELPLFDLPTIAVATDNFSLNNKLGEGGFGPVYRN
ncbi:LOW QUALITY PROTEIN: S-locus glycoprotein [Parasponia andersonii]|uniref:S-locus glycoprotein n=1 Tax=Parasponia andersonii TaxID=3476 RepID=A0A2P5BMA2_PARAD|nr:LOW QUALITY PROTEIN: S-locus glycoprotein [Parasponia andersonii]